MTLVCFIRYQIDPFQRAAFEQYAQGWGSIIPRCGGQLLGYFLPHEGSNDIAWGLIAFDSLACYEAYRTRLKEDPEGKAHFALAQRERFILREERTFLEMVDGTSGRPFFEPATGAPVVTPIILAGTASPNAVQFGRAVFSRTRARARTRFLVFCRVRARLSIPHIFFVVLVRER